MEVLLINEIPLLNELVLTVLSIKYPLQVFKLIFL